MFFIIWGKKTVYRRLGYVADFCPMCRAARPFALNRVGSASHVYYLSFGEGALVGHERSCQDCGTAFKAEPSTYTTLSRELLPLPELQRATFPGLEAAQAPRLALEDRIRHSPALLSGDERRALLREPFLFLSPRVERRFAATHIDKETGAAIVAFLVLLVAGPVVTRRLPPGVGGWVLLALVLAGLALVVWQFVVAGRRFMRRQVLPVLAKALGPLQPREAELAAVLAELKQQGHKIGKRVRRGDLQEGLQP